MILHKAAEYIVFMRKKNQAHMVCATWRVSVGHVRRPRWRSSRSAPSCSSTTSNTRRCTCAPVRAWHTRHVAHAWQGPRTSTSDGRRSRVCWLRFSFSTSKVLAAVSPAHRRRLRAGYRYSSPLSFILGAFQDSRGAPLPMGGILHGIRAGRRCWQHQKYPHAQIKLMEPSSGFW